MYETLHNTHSNCRCNFHSVPSSPVHLRLLVIGKTILWKYRGRPGENIILCEVLSIQDWYEMEVEIIEQLHGHIDSSTIKILGQDGLNCGEELDIFEVGDTLVLNLWNFPIRYGGGGTLYNYYIDGCNTNFLRFQNGMLQGYIYDSLNVQSYTDFVASLDHCQDYISTSTEDLIRSSVLISPNPSNGEITISWPEGYTMDIEFISAAGQRIKRIPTNIVSGSYSTNLSDYSNGLYYAVLKSGEKQVVKPFLLQK